jgi:hypothetical protein
MSAARISGDAAEGGAGGAAVALFGSSPGIVGLCFFSFWRLLIVEGFVSGIKKKS